jgi:molecular chaperone GrpE
VTQEQEQKQESTAQAQIQAQGRQPASESTQAGTEERERLREELEELKRKIAEKDEQLQAMTDRLKRLQADFENYKKRVAREREEFARLAEDQFLLKLLPIYDNMERAFRSYGHNNDKESFIEGMERIFAQFSEFLRDEGVRPIEALGQPFDPLLHEALLSVETDGPPNVVLEEFERGYMRAERVLRPSRVKVSRKRAEPPAQQASDADQQDETDGNERKE